MKTPERVEDVDQVVLDTVCPKCAAVAGAFCRTGLRRCGTHKARINKAYGVNSTKVHTNKILSVACPYCEVGPGIRCRSKGMQDVYKIYPPHAARIIKAGRSND